MIKRRKICPSASPFSSSSPLPHYSALSVSISLTFILFFFLTLVLFFTFISLSPSSSPSPSPSASPFPSPAPLSPHPHPLPLCLLKLSVYLSTPITLGLSNYRLRLTCAESVCCASISPHVVVVKRSRLQLPRRLFPSCCCCQEPQVRRRCMADLLTTPA